MIYKMSGRSKLAQSLLVFELLAFSLAHCCLYL